jgi:lipid-A-disaccharide synthase
MKIMISVGEASGDMHAASALQQLRDMSGDRRIEAFGMGGNRLAACDTELLVDNRHHAVMGLVEVLHKYPQLRANLSTLKKALKERQPDVLLLVDYPHFNMKLATEAKTLGIPVLYYIAPKVWASRPGRLQELTELVDHMAVIFPFEVPLFSDAGISTTYVGNPVLENKSLLAARNTRLSHEQTIALLPGSRKSEISNLLSPMLEAAKLIAADHPDIRFVLPVAETLDEALLQDSIAGSDLNIELIEAANYSKLRQCKAAIVSSGTATLELAMLEVPMVVAYRMNTLSYRVLKRWLTIKHISLVNIIAEREVVPELLQDDVTAEKLHHEIKHLIAPGESRADQLEGFDEVFRILSRKEVKTSLAKVMLELYQRARKSTEVKATATIN